MTILSNIEQSILSNIDHAYRLIYHTYKRVDGGTLSSSLIASGTIFPTLPVRDFILESGWSLVDLDLGLADPGLITVKHTWQQNLCTCFSEIIILVNWLNLHVHHWMLLRPKAYMDGRQTHIFPELFSAITIILN